MKKIIIIIAVFTFQFSTGAFAQATISDEYVQHLISEGRQYIIAILKTGPNQSMSEDSVEREQMDHLKYFFKLRDQGKVPVFGPFYNAGDLNEFCIFNSTSMNEVKALMDADPHIKSGYLVYEVHSWFGIPGDALPKE